MEKRAYDVFCKVDRSVSIRIIPRHFATKHSHVTHCIDMTQVKSQLNTARSAAKMLASNFVAIPVDTIISLDRMKMVGTFIASELSNTGINRGQNIAVISPEITNDKMLLRDNFLPYVKDRHVLLLTASATTGVTLKSGLDGIEYYGGTAVGAATVFGGEFECAVPVYKLFGVEDIKGYESYFPQACPLCRGGIKVDAVFNSYGYSKI